MSDLPPPETNPFGYLYTSHGHAEQLQRIKTEISDDPHAHLYELSDDERSTIAVRFIVGTETETSVKELPDYLQDADYCLFDSSYDGYIAGRPVHDIVRNMGFIGADIIASNADKDPDDQSGWPANIGVYPSVDKRVDAYVQSPHYLDRTPKPIVRTIGYGQHDHLPGTGLTPADTEKLTKPIESYHQISLFTDPNTKQLDRLRSIFSLTVPELRAKNAQLTKDISTIITSAVRRHPQTEPDAKLNFAVILDARHTIVASRLSLSGLFSAFSYTHHPFVGRDLITGYRGSFIHSARHKAEQEAIGAKDQAPTQASLERILLSDYLYETYLDKTNDSDVALRSTRLTEAALTERAVLTMLRDIDSAKATPLPFFNFRGLSANDRRKKIVTDLVWKDQEIAWLRSGLSLPGDQLPK